MELKLAKTAGFCMGVRRAVDIVLDIAQHEKGREIYTYGPLIHNPQTIELLGSRGVKPVNSIDEITDKKNAVLVIRTHGIAPVERKKIKASGVKVVDCTCPKVGYVQAIIKKHTSLGYTVIIVGDREHPEVDALLGYAGDKGIAVISKEDVDALPPLHNVCVVAQTTQTTEDYEIIINRIRKSYPDAKVFNTICSSTQERQAEVVALAEEMDAVIIVGGKNSANTRRLADLSCKQKTPTFQIETASEMKNIDLSPYRKIGVSAGASTPNWIIDRVMDMLASGQRFRLKMKDFLLKIWVAAVKTDIYSAIGAGCLCAACVMLQGQSPKLSDIAIASLFVYGMHVLNRLISRKPSGFIGSFREESYRRHSVMYRRLAIISIVIALALAFHKGVLEFTFLFLISLAGVLYNMKILPAGWRFQSLKDLPGSKNISMAAAWGIVTAFLPTMTSSGFFRPGMVVAFVFAFGLVFIRSAMSDILELQSDKLIGQETIPVLIGENNTRIVLKIISLSLFAVLVFSYLALWVTLLGLLLAACLLYVWICFIVCDRKSGLSGAVLEGLLETMYIIAGLSALIWSFF
ncbi:MAG TPA: 4-hydroxy-3-methylbut-2-enyl diphosphate reductase [Deltaproteobacteria bacterium]|nr:4-hydroxy-3-methylbut-2-enyl diphosphate reductase [Deltaproteobacteria bacterium]